MSIVARHQPEIIDEKDKSSDLSVGLRRHWAVECHGKRLGTGLTRFEAHVLIKRHMYQVARQFGLEL
jgi:hypothetical protein